MKTDGLLKGLDYPVPEYSMRIGYMLGGIALFLFIILTVSGCVLAWFGYLPTPEAAYRSMEAITASETLSGIRAAHAIIADVFIALLLLHVARIVATRSYHGERRKTWNVGILLLAVTSVFYFSGTVLKWDQEGYEAFSHLEWLLGGASETVFAGSVPMKMLVLHMAIAPVLLVVLLVAHLLLVKGLGISPLAPGAVEGGKSVSFLRHMRYVAAYALITIGLIKLAAAFYTPPLLCTPMMDVEWTKPPWPFLFLYPLESYGGMWTLWAVPMVVGAALFAIPSLVRSEKRRDLSQTVFLAGVALWAVLTLLGAWIPPANHMH